MRHLIEVGALVRLSSRPEWGLGQVQSLVGEVATVNFEHAGKVVIKLTEATLTLEHADWL